MQDKPLSAHVVERVAPCAVKRRSAAAAEGADPPVSTGRPRPIVYQHARGVDAFVTQVTAATPMVLVDAERQGVDGRFVKDLARRLGLPVARLFTMLGVPKATAEKKVAAGEPIKGSAGRSALGLARLLGMAQDMVANSTAQEAQGFDAARWLGRWLEQPQPALGGRKPGDLVDTPTGLDIVARLLGSIQSGAYT